MNQMIELSYKNLNDRNFIEAVKGLVNHKWDAMTTAYKLKKIMDKIDSESKKAHDLFMQEYKKIEMVETGEGEEKIKVPKDPSAFNKMQEEFLNLKCDVGNRPKIRVHELLGYKFSALDLVTLEPIIADIDSLEASAEVQG
jgi:hypothetical protein